MNEVKPDAAPHSRPAVALGCSCSRAKRAARPNHWLSTKPTAMKPITSRIAESGTCAAISQAAPTPAIWPGIMILRMRMSHCRQYDQIVTTSCTSRIGVRMPIAWIGGTAIAISGAAMVPIPEKPPFDSPSVITAGMASM